jgi:GNAT superfamily N-acetyltransferase
LAKGDLSSVAALAKEEAERHISTRSEEICLTPRQRKHYFRNPEGCQRVAGRRSEAQTSGLDFKTNCTPKRVPELYSRHLFGSALSKKRKVVSHKLAELGQATIMSWTISKETLPYLHPASDAQTQSNPAVPSLPVPQPPVLKEHETTAAFTGNFTIHFRPIRPEDESLLKDLFHSHSEQTILHRYFAPIHELSQEQIRRFVAIDYRRDFALVGLAPHEGAEKMICVGRYYRNPALNEAEVAITVHDLFQGRGIGTYLAQTLVNVARQNGINAFRATILANNHAMMHVFHKVAQKIAVESESGIYDLRFALT